MLPGSMLLRLPSGLKIHPDNWLTYHLAHPGPGDGFPGDPNPGMVYYKGRYHLTYIYAHRVGIRLCSCNRAQIWYIGNGTQQYSLAPITGHGMFSGTGFFTDEGTPAMIYHGEGSGTGTSYHTHWMTIWMNGLSQNR